MNAEYQQDREWEGSYHDQVLAILYALIPYLVMLEIASDFKDRKQATDFTVTLKVGAIACRLRHPRYDQRDWTIRSRRPNGIKTELAKLKEGCVSCYFYGWIDELGMVKEWMLINVDEVRSRGILERKWTEIPNTDKYGKPDGTCFIAIPATKLRDEGCLLRYQLSHIPRQVNTHMPLTTGIERARSGYTSKGIPKRQRTNEYKQLGITWNTNN